MIRNMRDDHGLGVGSPSLHLPTESTEVEPEKTVEEQALVSKEPKVYLSSTQQVEQSAE